MIRGILATILVVFFPRGVLSYPASDQEDSHAALPFISYHLESPPANRKALQARYRPEQLALLEKLNRSDVAHLPRLEALVVPGRWDLPELAYSPLPLHYPYAEEHNKALIVDLEGQVFGGYELGHLVRWGPISSGSASTPTPSGLFHLNWKSSGRHSTFNPEWYMRWYYNFDNREGRAFHAYALPGYPASHACIRLLDRDARWLFEWGESWELHPNGWTILQPGTPVVVVGQYRFGAPPPWRSLEWLATRRSLPPEPTGEGLTQGSEPAVAVFPMGPEAGTPTAFRSPVNAHPLQPFIRLTRSPRRQYF